MIHNVQKLLQLVEYLQSKFFFSFSQTVSIQLQATGMQEGW